MDLYEIVRNAEQWHGELVRAHRRGRYLRFIKAGDEAETVSFGNYPARKEPAFEESPGCFVIKSFGSVGGVKGFLESTRVDTERA